MTGGDSAAIKRKEKTLSIVYQFSYKTNSTFPNKRFPSSICRPNPKQAQLGGNLCVSERSEKTRIHVHNSKDLFLQAQLPQLHLSFHSTGRRKSFGKGYAFWIHTKDFCISTVTSFTPVSGICDWVKPKPTHYCVSLVPALLPSRLHQQGHSR